MNERIFYKGLRRMRKKRGFTQKDLSMATGTNVVTISLYENNKALPSLEKVYEFSDALDCRVIDLLRDESDKEFGDFATKSADLIDSWNGKDQKMAYHSLRAIDVVIEVSS